MRPSTRKDNEILSEAYSSVNESMIGTGGGALAGGMLGGPIGAIAGGITGSAMTSEDEQEQEPVTEEESPGVHKSAKQDVYKVSYHASHIITQEDLDSEFGGDLDQFIQEMIDQENPDFNDPDSWEWKMSSGF
jgi:uncharacterized protein YcfJ